MGKTRKSSRKEDLKKADSLNQRYMEHQEKIRNSPNDFSVSHWKKEKKQFLARIEFYYSRAKVKFNGIIN